jgi:hypothetical protein
MRSKTLGLAAAFVFAASAAYADDVMSNTYGNTITTKDMKTGASATLLFNADGTYVTNGVGADGKPVSYPGHWVINGANICLTPEVPAGSTAPGASCSPVVKHAVGETWSVTNDQGMAYQVSLSAGR